MSLDEEPLGAGRYSQSVAVHIFQIDLPAGEALLIDRDAELLGDAVDVIDVEVDERVWSCVAFVLREVDVEAPRAIDTNHGKPGSN